jgi:hypothetical protein
VLAHDDITAHNTFDDPAAVKPTGNTVRSGAEGVIAFPAASVTVLQKLFQNCIP